MQIKSQQTAEFFYFQYYSCKLKMLTIFKQSLIFECSVWRHACSARFASFHCRYDDGSAEVKLVFDPGLQHVSAIDGKTAF